MDGTSLLETATDFADCGWGYGANGHPLPATLAAIARALGPLRPWQRAAVEAGWAVGDRERAGLRAAGVVEMVDLSDVPF